MLESNHNEFSKGISSEKQIKFKLNKIRLEIKEYNNFFNESAPIYIHAYQLQNMVPKGLQISSYVVDNRSFKINALSYSLDPINVFFSLMKESPLIDFSKIKMTGISRVDIASLSRARNKSPDSIIRVEITGLFKPITPESRLALYNESRSKGLSNKLARVLAAEKQFLKNNR
tara:strand:- start:48 stop:566 length:519 start_codon:yes stop_codon:yes gene_type:complete